MSTPDEALGRLRDAADDGRLATLCERWGVRLLGVFVSVLKSSERHVPADLDIAVSLDDGSVLLGLLDSLVELTSCDAIDIVVVDRADPVLRSEALCGLGLYERTAGLYATSQMAALGERRDTDHLRALDLGALAS